MGSGAKFKFGLWLAEKRESERHPHLKASKPVEVGGQRFWAVAWFADGGQNNPERSTIVTQVGKFGAYMARVCGTFPIITVELESAEAKDDSFAPDLPDDEPPPF